MTEQPSRRAWPSGLAATVLLAAVLAAPGAARAGEDHDAARTLKEAGTIVPLDQVLAEARERHAGHLLEVGLERHGEGYVYEVELVDPEGVVWKMYFDAASGTLIESGRDED